MTQIFIEDDIRLELGINNFKPLWVGTRWTDEEIREHMNEREESIEVMDPEYGAHQHG